MTIGIYSTSQMLPVLNITFDRKPFWLGDYTEALSFTTEEIYFDRVFNDSKALAPFVVPNVQGRVMGLTGYGSRSFRPAYVKPKHVVDPNMLITRRPGEALATGSLTPDQRRAAQVAQILSIHNNLHINRREWMAAQATIFGQVTIASEDYPTTLVDFRRDASLTYTLTGAAKWDQTTATPLGDIKAAKINVNNRSGDRVTKVVFGQTAWDLFTTRVDLREQMNRNYGGQNTLVTLQSDGYEGQEFMGTIQGLDGAGRIDAWVDTSKYMDSTGTMQFFLPQNMVVGVGSGLQGIQCFGAIKDLDASLVAMEMFPKMWRVQDPSVEYIMTQSAPLMVPKQPDSSFAITVN